MRRERHDRAYEPLVRVGFGHIHHVVLREIGDADVRVFSQRGSLERHPHLSPTANGVSVLIRDDKGFPALDSHCLALPPRSLRTPVVLQAGTGRTVRVDDAHARRRRVLMIYRGLTGVAFGCAARTRLIRRGTSKRALKPRVGEHRIRIVPRL